MQIGEQLREWPREGRVGIATSGEYSGQYVFLFPDIDEFWGWYTSAGDDDLLPGLEAVMDRLGRASIQWLDSDDDARIEKEVFAMRPLESQFTPEPTAWDRLSRWVLRHLA